MITEEKQQLTALHQCDSQLDGLYHNYAVRHHLSDTAFWLLYIIWDMGEGCTQSDICETWFYPRQSIHSALKRLQMQGYLSLEAIPGNKKSKYIRLTEAGKRLAQQVITPLMAAEAAAFEQLDAQEKTLLVELSRKRVSTLGQQMGTLLPKERNTEP